MLCSALSTTFTLAMRMPCKPLGDDIRPLRTSFKTYVALLCTHSAIQQCKSIPFQYVIFPGDLTVIPGDLTVTPGDLTVTPGDLTVTPGDLTANPGLGCFPGTPVGLSGSDYPAPMSDYPAPLSDYPATLSNTRNKPAALSDAQRHRRMQRALEDAMSP